jgi:hypothetical protein
MDALKKSSDEATKAIGAGLVDALTILSKDKSIENLSDNFENLGNNIAFAIRELAKLVSGFNDLVSNPSFKAGLLALAIASKSPKAVAAAFAIIGGSAAAGVATRDFGGRELPDNARRSASRIELKSIKDSTKFRKLENEQLKKKTAIDELSAKFDVERIGFQKALNEATDEETKLRIKAQLAILDNNEALAKKILAELAAAEAAKKLAATYDTALDSIRALISRINAFILSQGGKLGDVGGGGGGGAITYDTALSVARATNTRIENFLDQFTSPSGSATSFTGMPPISDFDEAGRYVGTPFGQAGGNTLNITVDTSQTGDRFAQLIAESIQVAGRSGYSTTANGSL